MTPHRSARRRLPPRRRGFTLLEITVATAMIAVLLGTLGQLVVLVKRHARACDDHALALQTVENGLEQLVSRPWDEVTDAALAELRLPPAVAARWPAAAFAGSVEPSSDPLEAKRVSIALDLAPGAPRPAAMLTTWIYRAPRP